jgi:hypothetical protein
MKGEVDYLPSAASGGIIKNSGHTKMVPAPKVRPEPDLNGVMPHTNIAKVSWERGRLLHNVRTLDPNLLSCVLNLKLDQCTYVHTYPCN